jgi:glucan-binding YG repeat protein
VNKNLKKIIGIIFAIGMFSVILPTTNLDLMTTKAYADHDDEELDNVYLKSITLSSGDIDFAKRTYSYDVNVSEDCDEITIGAKPNCDSDEYENHKVKIDGTKVDSDDKFKRDVSLNKGENTIEIKVEDDEDNQRIYILNITRGGIINTNDLNTNDSDSDNAEIIIKSNQWIQVNGKWQYNDETGNSVKNAWVENYFLQEDGYMATGWLNYNGKWYYLGSDGTRKTGWQYVDGEWYYLDSQGKIETGWIKDASGKYYYLNSDGSMARNTTIDGYKLGDNGAWIIK